jgi:hypothetical protein
MIEAMTKSGSGGGWHPSHQRSSPRGRWLALLLLIIVPAVAACSSSGSSSSNQAPIGGRAADIGNGLLNRASLHCKLHPSGGTSAGVQQGSLLLGVSASLRLAPTGGRCALAKLVQQTGAKAERDDLSWATAEPKPNQYHWSVYDGVVRTTTEAGLTVLPLIDDAPSWAAPTSASVPSDPAPYATFVAAAVARYGPGGSFWRANPRLPDRPLVWFELWNEPYFADHNRDPATYANLVRAAVTAGRQANAAARFLIEATTSYQTLGGDQRDWLADMYAAAPDLGKYFDGLAIHPYGGDPAVLTSHDDIRSPSAQVEQAHAELVAHGDGDKPLWVTEIGWSTCSGLDVCVSQAQQAQYLRTFLTSARTSWRAYVQAVFIYALRDLAPNPPNERDAWFGLLRPDLTRKPAWYVLHAAAQGTP